MTRNELRMRKEAVLAAYLNGQLEQAVEIELDLFEKYSHHKLYRFRPPKQHEIDAIDKAEVFLCRARCYTDENDCKWIDNIDELIDLWIRDNKQKGQLIDEDKRKIVIENLKNNSRYIDLRNETQNMCLISCLTDRMTDYMWENYADHSSGICLEFDFEKVLQAIASQNILRFFPVCYLDNRNDTKAIQFGEKEYADETGNKMIEKYFLSCMTKEKVPYSREREWRIMCTFSGLDYNEDGKLFSFVNPDKIYIGKNANEAFRESVKYIAEKHNIIIEEL